MGEKSVKFTGEQGNATVYVSSKGHSNGYTLHLRLAKAMQVASRVVESALPS